jgi:hypothetical protein
MAAGRWSLVTGHWSLVCPLPLRCRCAVTALPRRCHGAVEPPHSPHGSTPSIAAPASHDTPRNCDLHRWRFLCRDWRLAAPARRRGYRWAAALLTLRFQTSASTLPTLWPSNYSTRGWVSARLWLRLGLSLAPTCPQPGRCAQTHRPVALLRRTLFPFCAHVPCPRNPNTSADASVAQLLLRLRSLHSPSPAVLHLPKKSADAV